MNTELYDRLCKPVDRYAVEHWKKYTESALAMSTPVRPGCRPIFKEVSYVLQEQVEDEFRSGIFFI